MIPFRDAFRAAAANKPSRDFPDRRDRRSDGNWLWPECHPSFTIDRATNPAVFTIGSCFARNIEEALGPLGFHLPTRDLVTPESERGNLRPNAVLNEFNPGTMQQRILKALANQPFDNTTLVPAADGLFADLLIVHGVDVNFERAQERRQQVSNVYQQLATSQVAVITLGLVEAWFDTKTQTFLNRMPPVPVMKAEPDRYQFRILDLTECLSLLEPAVAALIERNVRVVVTVSPVPLHTTMSGVDAVIANESSKAKLRLCAETLCRQFSGVDYFPSYEIVRSGGLHSYEDDHLHVKSDLVHAITQHMVSVYCPEQHEARSA